MTPRYSTISNIVVYRSSDGFLGVCLQGKTADLRYTHDAETGVSLNEDDLAAIFADPVVSMSKAERADFCSYCETVADSD